MVRHKPKVGGRRRVFKRLKYPPTPRPPEDRLLWREEQDQEQDEVLQIFTRWLTVLSVEPRWLATFAMMLAGPEWSYASIGRAFGLSRAALSWRMKTALERVRQELDPETAGLFE